MQVTHLFPAQSRRGRGPALWRTRWCDEAGRKGWDWNTGRPWLAAPHLYSPAGCPWTESPSPGQDATPYPPAADSQCASSSLSGQGSKGHNTEAFSLWWRARSPHDTPVGCLCGAWRGGVTPISVWPRASHPGVRLWPRALRPWSSASHAFWNTCACGPAGWTMCRRRHARAAAMPQWMDEIHPGKE